MAVGTVIMPATAQVSGSVGVGVGTVRTERRDSVSGSNFSSASLSPTLRYATPSFVFVASGFVASLPASVWASHARLTFRGATPRVAGRWRLGTEAILTGTTWSGGGWTSAAHGLGELFWSAPTWGLGVGAGPSAGWIAHEPSVVALHTRARAWWRPGGRAGGTDWQLSVEPTRFFGAWFTDVSGGVTLARGPAVLSLSTDARLSSVYGSTGAGSAFLQLFVGPTVSVELGGGSYLREPYQGFPRGGFVSFGVRIGSSRPARVAGVKRWPPLVPERRGDSLIVQFRFPGVRAVAIAGDWNAWQARPMRRVGDDLWEGTLVLARGLYHFNLLVDGRDWVVPRGVATVADGLGGMVAVLIAP